jgi:O-acetyl-ADP-ribose deacetylase
MPRMASAPAIPLLTAKVGSARLEVIVADITTLGVDAVVNAANRALLGGSGVDGAIHRAAGKELLIECGALGGCETGSAKITKGYRLPAKHVIHAVGPVWHGGKSNEDDLLAACYRRALSIARERALASIAFPAISTGVYAFPADRAARIAVGTAVSELSADAGSIKEVIFCCFSQESAQRHADAFAELGLN